MSIRLIIDSTSDMPEEFKQEFTVIPLSVNFGAEEYIDGVTITNHEFYEKLVESDVLPTTSQPTPAAFAEAYQEAVDAGDEVIVLTLSSKLSGTYQSACIAALDFKDQVSVIDTQNVTIGATILALQALRLVQDGKSRAEIVDTLISLRNRVHLVAMVDTLEYLKKGGRISSTMALAGTLLSIKPVLGIVDGEIAMLGKARGSKQGNNLLVKEIQAAGGVDFSMPVMLGYTGLSDNLLQKYISDSATLWAESPTPLQYTLVGSTVGTHAGPGAVAAAFFSKE